MFVELRKTDRAYVARGFEYNCGIACKVCSTSYSHYPSLSEDGHLIDIIKETAKAKNKFILLRSRIRLLFSDCSQFPSVIRPCFLVFVISRYFIRACLQAITSSFNKDECCWSAMINDRRNRWAVNFYFFGTFLQYNILLPKLVGQSINHCTS